MLSIAMGYDVKYLTEAVGGGREGYYTDAVARGEPPGVWYGAAAEQVGLSGEVDAELMEAVYHRLADPRDRAAHDRDRWDEAATVGAPHKNFRTADEIYEQKLAAEPGAGPERRAELRAEAERAQRQPVSFIDVTFSAPKSVSLLGVACERAADEARARGDHVSAAAWQEHARAIEEAVLAGARAGIDFLEDKACARTGHHGGGAGRWIDTDGLVAAQFLQHDSRNGDPHWHVHNGLLNRSPGSDGIWRALDSRTIHAWRPAASAVSARVCLEQLADTMGLRYRTRVDGHGCEVVDVSEQLMDWFSSRSRDIGPAAARLVEQFEQRHGREPSALERTRLGKRATLATRRAKSHHGETAAQQLDRWQAESTRLVEGGLGQLARDVLARCQRAGPADSWSQRDVIERGIADLDTGRGKWSRADLTRALCEALPPNLRIGPDRVRPLLERFTDVALERVARLTPQESIDGLPEQLRRADGTSVYANPAPAQYATPERLAGDEALRAAGVRRGAPTIDAGYADKAVAEFAAAGLELGADQVAAIRGVATSGAWVEALCAPAGTGKSVTVGALAAAWTHNGHRRVFGLAPWQAGAQVLAEEGLQAANTSAWLATQARLDQTSVDRPGRAGDERWRLAAGDLVVVDEAGTAGADQLEDIQARCEAAGAKLLLAGDPHQLAAIGPGGTLADLAEHGLSYELAEVRRFDEDWEAAASLRLRDGDTTALDDYQRHGRLLDGGTAEQAERAAARAWLADTLNRRDSLLLVGSNEAAARASATLRAELVRLRRVQETGVALGRQGTTTAGVGDLVQARRNGWELRGFAGNTTAPVNRAVYRVTGLRDDGGLTVAPILGHDETAAGAPAERLGEPLQLPASYVAADLTLGYASTVHAAQGRTVATTHSVIGPGTDRAGVYVGMTRGRVANTAHVITRAVADDAPTGATHEVAARSPRAVLAEAIEPDPAAGSAGERSALAEREHLDCQAASIQVPLDRLATEITEATAGRTGAWLDQLTAQDLLTEVQRRALAADEAHGSLQRLLRTAETAGHDPRTVLQEALAQRSLDGAAHPARVIHRRITEALHGQLTPRLTSYADLIPHGLPTEQHQRLAQLADAADDRRRQLGAELADQQTLPQWARETLGPLPADPVGRAQWEHAAGWAAAARELAGHADETDPLGPAPPTGLAEKHANWHTAHHALALPDGGGDEDGLSDGALRMRVRAWQRECHWAPRYVADELDATNRDARQAAADATLWAARADTLTDPAKADQLRADAADAQHRADQLVEQAEQLQAVDDARGAWYAHTAATRDAAHRAAGALKARGIDPDDPAEQTTGDEWLAAEVADRATEDAHRGITDTTLAGAAPADHTMAGDLAPDASRRSQRGEPLAEPPELADIRQTSTPDPTEYTDPAQGGRIPSRGRLAADIERAQAALAEQRARESADRYRDTYDTYDTYDVYDADAADPAHRHPRGSDDAAEVDDAAG